MRYIGHKKQQGKYKKQWTVTAAMDSQCCSGQSLLHGSGQSLLQWTVTAAVDSHCCHGQSMLQWTVAAARQWTVTAAMDICTGSGESLQMTVIDATASWHEPVSIDTIGEFTVCERTTQLSHTQCSNSQFFIRFIERLTIEDDWLGMLRVRTYRQPASNNNDVFGVSHHGRRTCRRPRRNKLPLKMSLSIVRAF
jgi:hypothetical protein